jgi:hypothetical protein
MSKLKLFVFQFSFVPCSSYNLKLNSSFKSKETNYRAFYQLKFEVEIFLRIRDQYQLS